MSNLAGRLSSRGMHSMQRISSAGASETCRKYESLTETSFVRVEALETLEMVEMLETLERAPGRW